MIQNSSLTATPLQKPGALRAHPLFLRLAGLCLVASVSSSCFAEPPPGPHPGMEAFAQKAAKEHQLDQQVVLELL
ncbi:MAG TPA: hypothetical protein VJN01_15585, partial [Xanthomonadales bacterium]|nr:hypothetical protein [Xanthomonadales bacterium]